MNNHNLQRSISELHTEKDDLFQMEVPHDLFKELDIPDLPDGYGYSGGVARAVALKMMGLEPHEIRDLDIVAVEDHAPNLAIAEQIERELMHDDVQHGWGIPSTTIEAYMQTRDFTMNELLVVDGVLYATPTAVSDLYDGVIRPTDFELNMYPQTGVGGKLAAKSLLMQVVFEDTLGRSRVEGVDFQNLYIRNFYIALALNKAAQYGEDVAEKYVAKLAEHGITNSGLNAEGLMERLYYDVDRGFEFRGSEMAMYVMGKCIHDDYSRDADYDDVLDNDHATRLWWQSGYSRVGGEYAGDYME